jgi:hypothetical protein
VGTGVSYLAEADRLREVTRQAAVTYGPSSQAVVFLNYEELIRLWHHEMLTGAHTLLRRRRARLVSAIQAAYKRQLTDREAHPTRIVRFDPLVVEFDPRTFQDRYASAAPKAVQHTWRVQPGPVPEGFALGAPHMFVIDDTGELLIWRRQFSFRELIFGRAKSEIAGVPVAHPMLVPERLRVRAAGEIVLIGDSTVYAIVANTKSGHFRPPPSTGEVVREACEELFRLPRERVDVFTIGGRSDEDHVHSTHRLPGALA